MEHRCLHRGLAGWHIARQQVARQQVARQQVARQQVARQQVARQQVARQQVVRRQVARCRARGSCQVCRDLLPISLSRWNRVAREQGVLLCPRISLRLARTAFVLSFNSARWVTQGYYGEGGELTLVPRYKTRREVHLVTSQGTCQIKEEYDRILEER
jgi:hypothetical protein